MRGYFAIGIEGVSKPMNLGNLFRTAHGFGAQFVFTINAAFTPKQAKSDTSGSLEHVPTYHHDNVEDLRLPVGCSLVGIELLDDSVDLPTFRHPRSAAYVLGPERGELSPTLLERCDHVIKIPTKFCLNVATAGAIVMYDRLLSMGRFPDRAVTPHGKIVPRATHVRGGPRIRSGKT